MVIGIITSFLVIFGSAGQIRGAGLFALRLVWSIAIFVIIWIYVRRPEFTRPRRVARRAVVVAVLYLLALAGLHVVALREARTVAADVARANSEQAVDVAAMATLGNPFEWSCITETDRATYKFNVSLLRRQSTNSGPVRFAKPTGTVATAVADAARDGRAQVLSEFMRFPGYRVVGLDCATQTLVQFADLRYTEPGKRNGSFSLDVPIECPTSGQQK
jgi:hypothetical protein